jgi:hypothetical protein
MSNEVDKALAAHEQLDKATYFLRATVGLTDEAATDTAIAQGAKFKYDAGVLTFLGKPVDRDSMVEWLKANGRSYLLPTNATDDTSQMSPAGTSAKLPKVDAALLAAAKAGNLTAKGRLFVQVGRDQSKLDALLTGTAADTSSDTERRARDALRNDRGQFSADEGAALVKQHKTVNPWSADGWNMTEQSRVYRVNPKLAASLSAAANSRIGATKPTPQTAA